LYSNKYNYYDYNGCAYNDYNYKYNDNHYNG
jgi:hypothetical protein